MDECQGKLCLVIPYIVFLLTKDAIYSIFKLLNKTKYSDKGGEFMAITSHLETKALIMQYNGGIVDGKQKVINRTISRTNSVAPDEKYHSTAQTLASLQELDLIGIKKREISALFGE